MKLINTKIKSLKIIKTNIYKDKRGFLKEVFKKKILNNKDFPFDVMSFSKKNVLRGLHIQTKKFQAKIITVTHGKIFDVAVDLRKNLKHLENIILWLYQIKTIFHFISRRFCTWFSLPFKRVHNKLQVFKL